MKNNGRKNIKSMHALFDACDDYNEHHKYSVVGHYAHAIEKHPFFCDRLTCLSDTGADTHLEIYRATLEAAKCAGDVLATDIIQCELYEAVQAYTHGDYAHAVEECYDAIAVLLRTIDVLEGRQELGRPEPKGGAR